MRTISIFHPPTVAPIQTSGLPTLAPLREDLPGGIDDGATKLREHAPIVAIAPRVKGAAMIGGDGAP
jgi:hypothetical protein